MDNFWFQSVIQADHSLSDYSLSSNRIIYWLGVRFLYCSYSLADRDYIQVNLIRTLDF